MDSRTRVFAKALTWQVAGLISMTVIGFLFTGSVAASGGIAFVGAVSGFAAYYLHEIAWSKVQWGRLIAPVEKPKI